ncbi:hypothetical protein NXX52_14615 [Bacteroides ovatus]|nr:hypothetical protein [Bacteroides ovatus]
MGALLQVQEKAEQDEEIVKRYDQIKTQLYIDLQQEFKDDLAVWRATIDSTLCIRFQEPSMLFDEGQSLLKPKFKNILDDFFPRYIAVLSRDEYRDNIEEIRIESTPTATEVIIQTWNFLRIEQEPCYNIALVLCLTTWKSGLKAL